MIDKVLVKEMNKRTGQFMPVEKFESDLLVTLFKPEEELRTDTFLRKQLLTTAVTVVESYQKSYGYAFISERAIISKPDHTPIAVHFCIKIYGGDSSGFSVDIIENVSESYRVGRCLFLKVDENAGIISKLVQEAMADEEYNC